MINKKDRNKIRKARHERIRNKISGTANRPRMNVYRSLNNIYVQFIDDVAGNAPVSYTHLFRSAEASELEVGAEIKADAFEAGEKIDVSGISKGKGFLLSLIHI